MSIIQIIIIEFYTITTKKLNRRFTQSLVVSAIDEINGDRIDYHIACMPACEMSNCSILDPIEQFYHNTIITFP